MATASTAARELEPSRKWWALFGLLLTACVASPSAVREEDEAPEAVSTWEEARADPSCVVPLCDEEGCVFWRCQDLVAVVEPAVDEAAVVLARGPGVLRPPQVVGRPQRWWGLPVAAPSYAEPVFEIPWHNWKTRDRIAFQSHRLRCLPPNEPFEKHHIFPQQKELASWFKVKRIDIHAFTIRVPKSFHLWLHSGGPEGGQWNAAWRQFKEDNSGATAEEIWKFAGELMIRFGVSGPFVDYSCQ